MFGPMGPNFEYFGRKTVHVDHVPYSNRNVCLKKWGKKTAFRRKKLGEKKGYQKFCSKISLHKVSKVP